MIGGGVSRKQQLVVDVRDFGAATALSDNSVAFNAALAAGSGRVYVPPGTWYAENLTVPSGVWLFGAGMYATTIKRVTTVNSPVIDAINASGGGVADLTVDGNLSGLWASSPDYVNAHNPAEVYAGSLSRVERVRVTNFAAIGIVQMGHDNVVTGCLVEGSANGDITRTITSISAANPTVVTTSTPHGLTSGQSASFSGTNSTPTLDSSLPHRTVTVLTPTTFTVAVNVTVSGNAGTVGIDAGPSRYGIFSADGTEKRNRVLDTTVHGCYWGAMFIGGEKHFIEACHMYDNHQMSTFTGGGQVAWTATGSGYHTLSDSVVEATASFPVSSANTYGAEITAVGVSVIGNTFIGLPRYGVIIQGYPQAKVTGNKIYNCEKGVFVNGGATDFEIVGNQASNIGGATSQTHGIHVESGASDRYVIAGNLCVSSTTAGILDEGTGTVKQLVGNVPAAGNGVMSIGTPSSSTAPTLVMSQTGAVGWNQTLAASTGDWTLGIDGGEQALRIVRDGTSVHHYTLSDNVTLTTGTGSPEGVVSASVGSLYLRTDGSTSTTLYVKTSGASTTGWTEK